LTQKNNAVVAGYSRFSLALVSELKDQITGRLYFVTPDQDQAMESRDDEANVLCALYAKNQGTQRVYARVLEVGLSPLLESLGIVPIQTSHTAASLVAITILKPSVAELVSLTSGQFDLEEVSAANVPRLVGCRLGNLHGKQLHVIAIAKDSKIQLGYNATIEPDSKMIIIYNHEIKRRLLPELRKVADYARSVRDKKE